ncbi:TetR/AcrR family transcriptional regulator [Marinomonas agarivorans]|nr:TetR/AcrR family transcriptional regulator [Marinomonas agarivorans]
MTEQKNNRQQQKLKTRKAIKSVAKKAFTDKGIEATNTREVSAKAGVAVGTFFSHFPDKMSLVKEIFFEEMTLAIDSRLDVLLNDFDLEPTDFSISCASLLFDFYLAHREYTMVVMNESLLQQGFLQTQLDTLKTSLCARFEAIDVDANSATIFSNNMMANFQYVLLAMLSAESSNKAIWIQELRQLNLPFEHIYQNALKRFHRNGL